MRDTRCSICVNCLSLYEKEIEAKSGNSIKELFVKCREKGEVKALPAMNRHSNNRCKFYDLKNDRWVLNIDTWEWEKVNAFGE